LVTRAGIEPTIPP